MGRAWNFVRGACARIAAGPDGQRVLPPEHALVERIGKRVARAQVGGDRRDSNLGARVALAREDAVDFVAVGRKCVVILGRKHLDALHANAKFCGAARDVVAVGLLAHGTDL